MNKNLLLLASLIGFVALPMQDASAAERRGEQGRGERSGGDRSVGTIRIHEGHRGPSSSAGSAGHPDGGLRSPGAGYGGHSHDTGHSGSFAPGVGDGHGYRGGSGYREASDYRNGAHDSYRDGYRSGHRGGSVYGGGNHWGYGGGFGYGYGYGYGSGYGYSSPHYGSSYCVVPPDTDGTYADDEGFALGSHIDDDDQWGDDSYDEFAD